MPINTVGFLIKTIIILAATFESKIAHTHKYMYIDYNLMRKSSLFIILFPSLHIGVLSVIELNQQGYRKKKFGYHNRDKMNQRLH